MCFCGFALLLAEGEEFNDNITDMRLRNLVSGFPLSSYTSQFFVANHKSSPKQSSSMFTPHTLHRLNALDGVINRHA
jgi:hypothetical protein